MDFGHVCPLPCFASLIHFLCHWFCYNTTENNKIVLACALGSVLELAYTCSQEPFVTNLRVARVDNVGNIYTAKISKSYKSGFFFSLQRAGG